MDMNKRKQQFLRWLVSNYDHKNPSVNFLIQFLSTHEDLMSHIRFSEDVKYAPRGIYISYQENSSLPFIYYKDQLSYTLSDQAFHDIRLNQRLYRQDFYIELNMPHMYQELYRFDIFEPNPYLPENIEAVQEMEEALYQITVEAKVKVLKKDLDKALEQHNFEEVNYFLNQIEKLKGE